MKAALLVQEPFHKDPAQVARLTLWQVEEVYWRVAVARSAGDGGEPDGRDPFADGIPDRPAFVSWMGSQGVPFDRANELYDELLREQAAKHGDPG